MRLVKLDATGSTNDFLKQMAHAGTAGHLTVVSTDFQTDGRGQMGAKWESQRGQNVMMSLLLKDLRLDTDDLFRLNAAVAVSVADALSGLDVPRVSVKWPNDILSGDKKLGGILIENIFRENGSIDSIVGIGINVNQTDFTGLPQASSVLNVTGKRHDKDALVEEIATHIQRQIENLEAAWLRYDQMLFKKGVASTFEKEGRRFTAIIERVTREGKLELLREDDSVETYGIREVKMLY